MSFTIITMVLQVRRRIKLEGTELEEYMKKKQEKEADSKSKSVTG